MEKVEGVSAETPSIPSLFRELCGKISLKLAQDHKKVDHFTQRRVEVGAVIGEETIEIGVENDPGIHFLARWSS